MATFELSEKKYKSGRRTFTATLYELQPPDCVVDNVGTKYNKNGITFLEEYASKALDSIEDMSVRVEFIDEERTMIAGHGETGIVNDMPVFENATVVGHFTEGYIDDVVIDGEVKRCVCGKGYLDEMCYPGFVATLEESLNNGISVDGSIEIYKTKENDAIVYKNGWIEKGRIPTEYVHSGWDMVISPADPASTLLELNNQKKEEKSMDFNMDEVKSVIEKTITELNEKDAVHATEVQSLNTQISELNSQIENKDAEISEKENTITELNASVEQLKKVIADMEVERDTWWKQKDILEAELAKAKVAEKLSELDTAMGEFNEAEKEVVKEDIAALQEKIEKCEKSEELENVTSEINSIKSKICMAIVEKQKADEKARKSEQNSHKKQVTVEDIFGEMYMETPVNEEQEDLNIF